MSRIFFTNNISWGNNLKNIFDYNYKPSYYEINDEYALSNYKKLNIDNMNSFINGNDIILCTGTLIYREKFGEEALRMMLDDAYNFSVEDLRRKSLGSYAVIIKKGNKFIGFVDETHTYLLYYYMNDREFLVSNSCWHIANIVNAQINEAALLEMGVRRCIMSKQTQYEGINKLSATEYFVYDCTEKTFKIKHCELNDYKQKFSSRDQAVNYIVEQIKEISAIRSKYISSCMHFLTGGIDSRLELSINSYNNDYISLGYWIGNDLITNGTVEDSRIVSEIGKKLAFSYKIFDVTEEFETALSNINHKTCRKYGEYASIYAGNSRWFEIFENLKGVESVGFGYLGESMRPLQELDEYYTDNFSSLDFIKKIYCRCGLEKDMFQLDGFYDFLQAELKPLIEYNKGDESNLTKNLAFKLFSYSRFEADCLLNNFGNTFVYSFPILGCKKIADAVFSLEYDWLKDDFVSIKIIEKLSPNMLDFPIYSHHRAFRYKKDTSTMTEELKYRTLDKMKRIFKNTFVYKVLYLKYAHNIIRPQSKKNEDIMKVCSEIMGKKNILSNSTFRVGDIAKWKGGDIGTIATFIADLLVLLEART